MKKIKVLWYSDFLCGTGFGTVAHNLVRELNKTGKYEFTVVAINHRGEPYNYPESPYYAFRDIPVFPACKIGENDLLGKKRLINIIKEGDFDILFTLQDLFNLNGIKEELDKLKKPIKWVLYFPVDAELKKEWVTKVVEKADYAVTYTEYGKEEVLKHSPNVSLDIIPHGSDLEQFHPLPKEEVEEFANVFFEGFYKTHKIIMNLNRNQPRKDISRTIRAFAEYSKTNKNVVLYLHCNPFDEAGVNLKEVLLSLPDEVQDRIIVAKQEWFADGNGMPINFINLLYNSVDLVTSTTLGEGWGLCLDRKTKVWTSKGLKTMEMLGLSDMVLSSDGGFHEIKNITSRNYTGKLYKFKTWKGQNEIISSDNHKFLLEGGTWKEAKDLKIGDPLVFPKILQDSNNSMNCLEYLLDTFNSRQKKYLQSNETHFWITTNFDTTRKDSVKIPINIELDDDLSFLFGLYVAEGSFNSNKGSINFSLHKKEKGLANEISRILLEKFGLTSRLDNAKYRGDKYEGCTVVVYSTILGMVLSKMFGKGARNIKVDFSVLPKLKFDAFLKGVISGDGSISKNEVNISTTSEELAATLRLIGNSLGIITATEQSRSEYKVRFSDYTRHKLLQILDQNYVSPEDSKHSNPTCKDIGTCIVYPIKTLNVIDVENYPLMDIEVEGTHDFVAENVIAHNCTTESMSCGTPVVMPDNTATTEIIGKDEERGYLVRSGTDENLKTVLKYDNGVIRPLTDIADLIKGWDNCLKNEQETNNKKLRALNWVKEFTWENLAKTWETIFDKVGNYPS